MAQQDGDPFVVGEMYSREYISKILGGSERSFIPGKNGWPVAICPRTELNPDIDQGIYIIEHAEAKSHVRTLLRLWIDGRLALPTFYRRNPNQWEYVGIRQPIYALTHGALFEAMQAVFGKPIDTIVFTTPVLAQNS